MRADSRTAEEAEDAVPDDDKKQAAHRALVDRVLSGEGRASVEQRARAFSNDGLSPPLDALIGKVALRPTQVTEADFTTAKALGLSEDQLFELVFYRPDFYGARAKEFTHEAMRGPSSWSVGDRELMAAYVSKVNESAFCVGAHTATASQAYQDGPRVAAVLADLESAPVDEPLLATLRMLGKLTAEGKLSTADMPEVLAAGVSPEQVEDALAVCAAFNTTDRLAEAFGFEVLSPEAFAAGAKYLLKRGYR